MKETLIRFVSVQIRVPYFEGSMMHLAGSFVGCLECCKVDNWLHSLQYSFAYSGYCSYSESCDNSLNYNVVEVVVAGGAEPVELSLSSGSR